MHFVKLPENWYIYQKTVCLGPENGFLDELIIFAVIESPTTKQIFRHLQNE